MSNHKQIAARANDSYIGKGTLGTVEEILIEFGIEDEEWQRDIFHSHFVLIITRKDKNCHSRIQAINECDEVVLNRIFAFDDKTEIFWDEDNVFTWQESVYDVIINEYPGPLPLNNNITDMIDKVIGRIEKVLEPRL